MSRFMKKTKIKNQNNKNEKTEYVGDQRDEYTDACESDHNKDQ